MSSSVFRASPLSANKAKQTEQLLSDITPEQLLWLSGYLSGLSQAECMMGTNTYESSLNTEKKIETIPSQTLQPSVLKILYGTHSGNSAEVARQVEVLAVKQGLTVEVENMKDYKLRNLKNEKFLIIVISTYGKGVPPVDAEEFYAFVNSRKISGLQNLSYGVIALGDSSYKLFCKTGIDIDRRLAELGANRIQDVVKCDTDYESDANEWALQAINSIAPQFKSTVSKESNEIIKADTAPTYSKRSPFDASVLERIQLNGRGSEKSTYHVELSLEDSGLSYEPGDALGVYGKNSKEFVTYLLEQTGLDGRTLVKVNKIEKPLKDALLNDFEISKLTPVVVANYAAIAQSIDLNKLIDNELLLEKYILGRDVIDLIKDYPSNLTPELFIGILRKLSPRLYSIASSSAEVGDEVHITVGGTEFESYGRKREGAVSSYIGKYHNEEEPLRVYIDKNNEFRLPADNEAPVIMIGSGTGIAPFRAFLQERRAREASGKNWLFFGNQHFETDFLYQQEIIDFVNDGTLTNIDLAFSRDQDQKIYVQHRMYEHSTEIFKWIEQGAYIYICGDKENMAKSVRRTLYQIISKEGYFSEELASEYFEQLIRSKRILLDVY